MKIEDKFNYRYNPKSNRLGNYDYWEKGSYFITICCKDRQEYFWEIIEGKMVLNEYWKVIYNDIKMLEKHYEYVLIDELVVMPDHVHFIMFLNRVVCTKDVSEKHLYSNSQVHKFSTEYYENISPKKWELGNIIKLLKWYATKKMNKIDDKFFFAWQRNYYDRIIRNDDELNRIRKYIQNNPLKWEIEKDKQTGIFM